MIRTGQLKIFNSLFWQDANTLNKKILLKSTEISYLYRQELYLMYETFFFFLKSVSNCTQMKNSSSSFLCILPLWSFWILRFRSVVTAFFGGTAASIYTHIMWSFTSQFVVFQNQRDKTWHFWWGRVGGGIVHSTLPCCNFCLAATEYNVYHLVLSLVKYT